MRTFWHILLALACVLSSRVASAQVELKNDGFNSGDAVGFQAGFVAGEIGASRFTPPAPGVQVLRVRFLFGGAAGSRDVTVRVWDDSAGATNPGAELFMGDFTVTASDTMIQEVDLTADAIMVPGTFRVGIEFQSSGLPSIARDNDGTIAATKNFIMADGLGWAQSNMLGLTGDWIIRVDVGDPAGTPDAGVLPQIDAGGPGTPDSGIPGGPDAATGSDCTSNAQCTLGEYCSAGMCTFDCRMDDDCGAGSQCNSLGMCVAAEGGDHGACACRTTSAGGLGAQLAGLCGMAVMLLLVLTRRRR